MAGERRLGQQWGEGAGVDPIQPLEPGPDGATWPDRFGVDREWADDRGTAWRAVTNHPVLRARRSGDLLELKHVDHPEIHTYLLSAEGDLGYIATKEN